MIIPINWIKKYTTVTSNIEDLATLIGSRLVEIESVKNINDKYKKIVTAKIIDCSPLEGSDHLNVTKIDDGGVTKDIERDENGLVQVVCGAPNVRTGMTVVWLPPDSIVPETFGSQDPFTLSAKPLRGVTSNGMLASAKELDLYEDHTGILEMNSDIQEGKQFSELFEFDDALLDIENKSLTHRPDTFGIIGFAREVAAIQGIQFSTPDWLKNKNPNFKSIESPSAQFNVTIDDTELSARYQAVVLSGADASRQTPFVIQSYLSRIGMRPINTVVDVTNYLMMVSGQPLHAFDYDKVKALGDGYVHIHVRRGRNEEQLELLDGRTITLTTSDIVIASGDIAIGLAGAMGGANTAIDETTKNIILESATFNLYSLRSTQMRHGIFSEAITRFTKGQPAELTAPVLHEAIRLMEEWSGASQVSPVTEAYPNVADPTRITIPITMINDVLGSHYSIEDVVRTLGYVEFDSEIVSDSIIVTAPFWRTDIHIQEDIIEEVGRLNGFDTIQVSLPQRNFTAVMPEAYDLFRSDIRKELTRTGANEILSYSFIHGDLIDKAGESVQNSYRITNSISPDLQYYRQTLTPSVLSNIFSNHKAGYDSFALYEINKVHRKDDGLTNENVPVEVNSLAFAISNIKQIADSAYYAAKDYLEFILLKSGVDVTFELLDNVDTILAPSFERKRSAVIRNRSSNRVIGIIGEYKKSVARSFKLETYSAGFEINLDVLYELSLGTKITYAPLGRYPGTDRDMTIEAPKELTYERLQMSLIEKLSESDIQSNVVPLSFYVPDNSNVRRVTFRIKLNSYDHTLKNDEVNALITSVGAHLSEILGTTVI